MNVYLEFINKRKYANKHGWDIDELEVFEDCAYACYSIEDFLTLVEAIDEEVTIWKIQGEDVYCKVTTR